MTAVGLASSQLSTLVSKAVYVCALWNCTNPHDYFWLLIWPAGLSLHSFLVTGAELTKLKLQYFHIYCCHCWQQCEFCFSEIITSRLSEWGRNSLPVWMGVIYMLFFSIPSLPCLTLLSVTAKSSADFDPSVVLFDDECKWLTLKLGVWLKFSEAIHRVLGSPICLGRITDVLGARFHICIQNGVRCMQKTLTVWSQEEQRPV